MLIEHAVEEFLEWCDGENKPSTTKRVRATFTGLVPFLAEREVDSITADDLNYYKTVRREAGIKDATLHNDLCNASKFFQYAMRREWCQKNPVREIKVPSGADSVRQPHVLEICEEEEYFKAARAASENLYDVGRLRINQGIREAEALKLRVENIDLDNRALLIPSGKSKAARRLLPLTEESAEILARRVRNASPEGWLFPSPRDPKRPLSKLNTTHTRVCQRFGFRFIPYDLRHTFATRYARHDGRPEHLRALLGHKDLRTVCRYVHPTFEDLREGMAKHEAMMKARYNSQKPV
jgi:integrase